MDLRWRGELRLSQSLYLHMAQRFPLRFCIVGQSVSVPPALPGSYSWQMIVTSYIPSGVQHRSERLLYQRLSSSGLFMPQYQVRSSIRVYTLLAPTRIKKRVQNHHYARTKTEKQTRLQYYGRTEQLLSLLKIQ